MRFTILFIFVLNLSLYSEAAQSQKKQIHKKSSPVKVVSSAAKNQNKFHAKFDEKIFDLKVESILDLIKKPEQITTYFKFVDSKKLTPALVQTQELILQHRQLFEYLTYFNKNRARLTFGDWHLSDEKQINKYFLLTQLCILHSRATGTTEMLEAMFEITSQIQNNPSAFIATRVAQTLNNLILDELEKSKMQMALGKFQIFPNLDLLYKNEAQYFMQEIKSERVLKEFKKQGVLASKIISEHLQLLDPNTFEQHVQFYLEAIIKQYQMNPFVNLKQTIKSAKETNIKLMQGELGSAFKFVESLTNTQLSENPVMLTKSYDRKSKLEQDEIKKAFQNAKLPLNRAFLVLTLNHLESIWGENDIQLYKALLTRVGLLVAQDALYQYQAKYKSLPSSFEQLKNASFVSKIPSDYFSGQALLYHASGKVWSVGENGTDEAGGGDDLSINLK